MPKASDQEQAERCATPRRDLSKSEYTSAFRWRSRRIDSSVAAHASLAIAKNDRLSIDEAIAKVTGGRVDASKDATYPAPERHEPIIVTAEPERAPLGEDAEELMFVDFDQIPRDMQPNRTPNPRYFGVAEQRPRHAGRWACVMTFAAPHCASAAGISSAVFSVSVFDDRSVPEGNVYPVQACGYAEIK